MSDTDTVNSDATGTAGTGTQSGPAGRVRVGTCSWTDRALVSSGWYPHGRRDAEGMLRHYAQRFPLVEADSAYYAPPSARNTRLWAERTPPGFVFDVKAYALLTGHSARVGTLPRQLRPEGASSGARLRPGELPPGTMERLWEHFVSALAPLHAAGRLGCVLLQFPPWFRPGRESEAHLAVCRERARPLPVAVEFRDPGWLTPDRRERTLRVLRREGLPLVAVDTVQGLPRSVPPVTEVTEPGLSVVRLHGRNPSWGAGGKEERFRYRYDDAELREWVPRIRALEERSDRVHVLFNNCCGSAAVTAAERMTDLLDGAGSAESERAMAENQGAPAPAGPDGPNGKTGAGKSEEDRQEDVRQALRAKDPEEEVEEALGSRPEPPGEDDRKSAEEQPGEPPD